VTLPEGKEAFPSQFGRYTLVERLATGGMAEVFKAKILSTHGFEKLLVIKRILPHLAADKTFVAMFIDEAKLTAQLVHPKIVQVSDFGEVNGQFFIALEFVDGFDALALLRSSAQRQVRLPVPICMFIAIEVLDALDYAHNARDGEGKPMRLVHRDISPSNVFISRRGDVKLGDFGIAHAQERESKTQAGTLKGKYGYMSPEQVVGGSLDGRSDLFAVGIVLAEMIMGRRLFTAPNDLDVLLMVRDGRLDRLDKYCKDLPPDLDSVVRKGLQRKVAERFQTAAEFRDTLADLLFKMQFRVGPSDVGRLASDYFDPSPEALVRLKEQAKRLRVRPPTAVYPAVSPADLTPPPRVPSQGGSQRHEWGMVTPPPHSDLITHPARPASTPPPAPPAEVEVPMEDLSAETPPLALAAGPSPAPPRQPAITTEANVLAALDQILSQPLAIVDLDQYEAPSTGGGVVQALPPGSGLTLERRLAASASGAHAAPAAPAAPTGPPQPDDAGDLSVLSSMRVFADLVVSGETGLLRFETASLAKNIYLLRGTPESLSSNQAADRFGDYLVARGFMRAADLERAYAQLPMFGGKLSQALVGLGNMKPPDVLRLQSQHVRERVMDIFTWTQGVFSFFRNQRNPVESTPLGLDSFEIMGAGVLTLSHDFLQSRFLAMADFRPHAAPQPRIPLDTFRLGSKPRDIWSQLDGKRTVRQLMTRYAGSASDTLTFMRVLYLLIETDLARLE
jgi:serine/threonine protein kinase